jgi:phage terminase large subunit-like protein
VKTGFERVWDYAHDIVEGVIPACKKHIWAAQRFIDDIYRLEEEDCPYYFDAEVIDDFDEWSKQFVHLEGVLAGQPIILTDIQLFIGTNIFAFKKKSNNARRFRKVYIQLARKNAKSQFLALIATYETFLSDEKHRVYIAGWSRDQSAEVYDAIHEQIQNAEILEGTYKDSYGKITRIKTNSIIQPLSKEARKLGDGKNPSVGIVDEYHAHETSEIYDVLISGMVARKSPLMVIITTAGFDLSRPCFREYEYVSRILDPDDLTENEDYYALICELDEDDDIKDEENWIKANPIVATYPEGLDSLRSDLKTALDQPEKMRPFLTKNMNRWVDMKDNGYMNMSKWRKCFVETSKTPDLTSLPCYVGVDLSSTTDLTSVGFVFLNGEKFIVRGHSFIPEEKLKERIKTDKMPFDLWVKQKWISTTPGEAVDYNFVEKYIIDCRDKYGWNIQEVCYDEWNASQLAQNLESDGFIPVKIIQGLKTLSEPTKKFRTYAYQKKVAHDNNPVIDWAMGNAVTKMDANENFQLDKKKSRDRIDPAASIINAFVRAMYGHSHTDLLEFSNTEFLDKIWG